MSEKKPIRHTIQISESENARLQALVRHGGWSVSWVIRRALVEYLERAEAAGKIEVPAA